MPEAVIFDGFRQRLAAHMAGVSTLAPIAYMAYGDGGHDADNKPKPAASNASGLYREFLRKPLAAIMQDDPFSVTGRGIINADEISNGVLSEAALIDADGHPVGWKTFPPKYTEDQESYAASLKLRF